ncbi:lipopolysaccharide transport system permease protein [Singulisphaera sp. GP187]|uniref:ABC transporter permease n=1 Tax=Singulisphaera sp. GP187 TaxID=1882752 RepID=UPI00092C61F6|nr:ABC transporter permease [Singulisphaera sp. GP187]SIN67611.1 lipopolysaccharide transport system permease protein [Singulisphaera sp. GP187]
MNLLVEASDSPISAPDITEPHAEAPVTVIEPPSGWQLINVRELWQFRELLGFLIWRDVKVRYKQTILGAGWTVLQPLMMMVVFTIFFGRMAKVPSAGLPYPLFAYAGLLPWTFFATAITNAGNSVVASERLITKIYFPRLSVPFAAVGAAVVDLVVAFGLLLVMMVYYRVVPGVQLLFLPVIAALITLTAMGIGTGLSALNVAYRDFRYMIPFLVQLGMFATPSVYMQPESKPSAWLQSVMALNPMTAFIDAFRATALGGPIPWGSLGIAVVVAAVVFVVGCFYFRKVEDSFADII